MKWKKCVQIFRWDITIINWFYNFIRQVRFLQKIQHWVWIVLNGLLMIINLNRQRKWRLEHLGRRQWKKENLIEKIWSRLWPLDFILIYLLADRLDPGYIRFIPGYGLRRIQLSHHWSNKIFFKYEFIICVGVAMNVFREGARFLEDKSKKIGNFCEKDAFEWWDTYVDSDMIIFQTENGCG